MDELDFEYYRQQSDYGNLNEESRLYFLHQAQNTHALVVHQALLEITFATAVRAQTLSNTNARYFMMFGAGRRLRMLFASYREITAIIMPDRMEPLLQDDVGVVTRDLNVIYLNIPAILDNFAACVLHEAAKDENTKKLGKIEISLFSPKFMADSAFAKLAPIMKEFAPWYRELKERRDPVAHRIPLYVPPAVLNPDEFSQYEELGRQIAEAHKKKDFKHAEALDDEQGKLGTFVSCFLHHPDEGRFPIYPTVPQDIAMLAKIGKHIEFFFNQHSLDDQGSA